MGFKTKRKERNGLIPDWPRLLWNLVVALEGYEEDLKRMSNSLTMLGSESLARSRCVCGTAPLEEGGANEGMTERFFHRPGRKILKNHWRFCRNCGYVGRVMNPVSGCPCTMCQSRETLLIIGSEPKIPKRYCEFCRLMRPDIGDIFERHQKECKPLAEKLARMAQEFFSEHPEPTIGDIFGRNPGNTEE